MNSPYEAQLKFSAFYSFHEFASRSQPAIYEDSTSTTKFPFFPSNDGSGCIASAKILSGGCLGLGAAVVFPCCELRPVCLICHVLCVEVEVSVLLEARRSSPFIAAVALVRPVVRTVALCPFCPVCCGDCWSCLSPWLQLANAVAVTSFGRGIAVVVGALCVCVCLWVVVLLSEVFVRLLLTTYHFLELSLCCLLMAQQLQVVLPSMLP